MNAQRRQLTIAVLLVAMLAVMGVQPGLGGRVAQAQGGVTWTAEYYDNPYLIGTPKVTRSESGLAFNWGGGSPASGVPADNFSARFASDVYFNAGTYRFHILADDGVKLWIDFPPDKRPTIDSYNAPQPGTLLTADVTLSGGYHHIQIDFREVTGDAYLYVYWDNLADGVSGPSFPVPVQFTVQWTAQYFNNNFLGGTPNLVRSEPSPTHYWGTDAPAPGIVADHFSARWIVVQYFDAGRYTISVVADDGVRVIVDGRVIIDEWHTATGQTYRQTLDLAAGQHNIIVEYVEQTGLAHITFTMVREPGGGTGTATPLPSGAYARVTAWVLNVRDAPLTGNVITKIRRGETYPVVGRNADSSWWQINVNGTVGWVSGAWVVVTQGGGVGVTTPTPIPTPTVSYGYGQCPGFLPSRLAPGMWGRVTPGLPNNLRAQPSLSAAWIGQIPGGGLFRVLGGPVCANNSAWFQVNYNGLVGWTMEGQGAAYWLEPY
ncbi:MAG: PA14 domain-containing protein [Chloroflexota bacterium]